MIKENLLILEIHGNSVLENRASKIYEKCILWLASFMRAHVRAFSEDIYMEALSYMLYHEVIGITEFNRLVLSILYLISDQIFTENVWDHLFMKNISECKVLSNKEDLSKDKQHYERKLH